MNKNNGREESQGKRGWEQTIKGRLMTRGDKMVLERGRA